MSSANRTYSNKISPKKNQADSKDNAYAETVYRTVMGSDGIVKDQYL